MTKETTTKKTVIIIGAGASADFKTNKSDTKNKIAMPTGEELVKKIADEKEILEIFRYPARCNSLSPIYRGDNLENGIRSYTEKLFPFHLGISRLVQHYQPFSIDELFDSIRCGKVDIQPKLTQEDRTRIKDPEKLSQECQNLINAGKELIAFFLLQAENEEIFDGICWYRHLRNMIITSGKNPEEIEENLKNLTIISFNYDRSLDEFLKRKLGNFYDKINIIYPYGSLAESNESIPYGNYKNLLQSGEKERYRFFQKAAALGENLQTIGALKTDDRQKLKTQKIKESMSLCLKFYFLGFGFHKENCEVINLSPKNGITSPSRIDKDGRNSGVTHFKIHYTNFKNSKKTEQKFNDVVTINSPEDLFTSSNGVYNALAEDFDLSLF